MQSQSKPKDATVLAALIGIELVLVLLYLLFHFFQTGAKWGPLKPLFDLNSEISIPTWFSSMQLFVLAAVLFWTARYNRRAELVSSAYLWAGGCLFVFLSADEAAAMHEKITLVARTLGLREWMFNGKNGAWIAVYLAAAVLIALLCARPLRALWSHYRRESFVGACGVALLFAGGAGVEAFSYRLIDSPAFVSQYRLLVALEEFLEMSGASLMLYAALRFARLLSTAALKQSAFEPLSATSARAGLGSSLGPESNL